MWACSRSSDKFAQLVERKTGGKVKVQVYHNAQLGNETADFWSLPTTNLPADAQARMAAVCGESLAFLRKQVADAGCMP